MITETYVSFKTAKLLKEAGFDSLCRSQYTGRRQVFTYKLLYNFNEDNGVYSRPTQALAARWLREAHSIVVDVAFDPPKRGDDWRYFIGDMENMVWAGDFNSSDKRYDTYEEAMEDALQEALRLIIKDKENGQKKD